MRAPIWVAEGRRAPRLRGNVRADVCVVGAGIAGLATAWRLANAGRSVVVLDGREPGTGETSRTTAHLVTALDRGWNALASIHGESLAQLAADSHRAAIDQIEALCGAEGADCHFERLDGFLFAAPRTAHTPLEAELDAARRAGIDGVEMVPRAPLRGYDTGPCLRFPRQAVCHPLRLVAALRSAITRGGGRVFGRTRVETVDSGRPFRVHVAGGATVSADAVVVATNSPIAGAPTLHAMQAPYRTYAIAAPVPRGSITNALYWDTEEPFHYVRLGRSTEDRDVLIVGGEDHRTGQGGGTANERYRRLVRWSRVRFPTMGAVTSHWSGQVMEPVDGLAYIGRNPGDEENVYIATGDSGQGMTHGTIAGMLLTDLIQGRKNKWEDLYSPTRLRVSALTEYASENINVAGQYADYVTAGDIKSESELKPCEGAVMRDGMSKVAVFRDRSGRVHKMSAVCPHLGCVVAWNSTEETWDCPCHGSRFSAEGRVYQGPANSDLEAVK